ncbi:hypothetical protein CRE_26697 [Caenorhabditis remanei]|uniref:F-box domain-containing protein n=1 Tax=Caenorhabditis remanei TaxID=31234 RepID=E3ML15_CAERE|nr:hypothetical protein CRE_26697 [Caenorhabditis remanei]
MDQLTSPKSLRKCILFEFFRGKPVFETYKSFCEVMGYEAITLKEFEIWYHRFSRGEFDLEYDIRLEPKTRDFCQLPTCVIEKVLEKTSYKDQLSVRKVSRDLKSIVDSMRSSLKSIEMIWHSDHIKCRFNDHLVVYSKKENIKCHGDDVIRVIDENYEGLALRDWKFPMRNPKLRLDILKIECKEPSNRMRENTKIEKLSEFVMDLCDAIESIWRVNVQKLQIDSFHPKINHVEYILQHLVPGYLKSIVMPDFDLKRDELNVEMPTDPAPGVEPSEAYKRAKSNYWRAWSLKNDIYEVIKFKQWKEAEELHLKYNWDYFYDEDLIHFKRFHFTDCNLDRKRLIHLREIFSESTNFELCTLTSPNFQICSEYLESFCEKLDSGDPSVLILNYKIPDDSNKMLEFKLDYNQRKMIISKKIF